MKHPFLKKFYSYIQEFSDHVKEINHSKIRMACIKVKRKLTLYQYFSKRIDLNYTNNGNSGEN